LPTRRRQPACPTTGTRTTSIHPSVRLRSWEQVNNRLYKGVASICGSWVMQSRAGARSRRPRILRPG
jgi:hypothetical protein